MNYLQTDQQIRGQIIYQNLELSQIQTEEMLGDYLLQHQSEIPCAGIPLTQFPYVHAREYFVHPPYSHLGKGDFIFTDGQNRFAIVEIKYLPPPGSGKTARNQRTVKRKKVAEQAEKYAREFKTSHPDAEEVFYGAITNENLNGNRVVLSRC